MKRFTQRLRVVAERIGRAQAWLILTVFYLLLLVPVALVFRMLSDPLQLRRGCRAMWRVRSIPPDRAAWLKAQS